MEFSAEKTSVEALLTEKVLYESPLFQRRYVWDRAELNEFWNDIEKALDEAETRKFLGAITVHFKAQGTISKPSVYWVIDGQQRLTTAYLTLLAMADVAHESNPSLRETLIREYLVREVDGKRQSRISPTLADFEAFKTVHESSDVFLPAYAAVPLSAESRLQDAFSWLRQSVAELVLDKSGNLVVHKFEELGQALLKRLDFVLIYLGNDHDPQEVFDRLNRAGIRLSLAELLKNVIFKPIDLSSIEHAQVHALEAEVWKPFFNMLGSTPEESSTALSDFVFPYAVTKSPNSTRARAVDLVETYWLEQFSALDPLDQVSARIADMEDNLEAFLAIKYGPHPQQFESGLSLRFERLNRFQPPIIAMPFFIEALRAYRRNALSRDDLLLSLDIIESFFVRRVFVGMEPTGLHAIFKKLWSVSAGAPDKVRAGLQSNTIVFPDDASFMDAARTGPLYARRKHKYILWERERAFAIEVPQTDLDKVQADHLIPQNPPPGAWPEMSAEVHAAILHQWGNLALMTKPENTIKSNRTWAETREIFGSKALFASARNVIDNFETFTAEDVEARSAELAAWALERWPEGPSAG